jgi:pimeloyl-ACP methyl ester carboxylesterase
MIRCARWFAASIGLLAFCAVVLTAEGAQQQGVEPAEIVMRDVVLLPNVATGGRTWLREDHHEAALIHVGTADYMPSAGDRVTNGPDTDTEWFDASASEDGWVASDALRGGYAFWRFESTSARVMILEATGHSMVYVNGLARVGDPYETGYVRVPVLVRNGMNMFHFRGARGRVKAKLVEAPASGVALNTGDMTLGDVAAGTRSLWHGSVVLLNATREPLSGLRAVVEGDDARAINVPTIPPLGIRKIVFSTEREWGEAGERELNLQVVRAGTGTPEVVASTPVRIRVRNPESGETFKYTFFSRIDGSLQYYAARRATGTDVDKTGLVLTLHGASVEATSQADAYAPKEDFHIVAPTNRRPYGFDWEDWGRIDALEVLEDAAKRFPHNPRRVYLTGHSMGGHGVWQIGGLFPGKFAAIAPSAGWPTFWTYTERGGKAPWETFPPTSLIGMVHRGTRTSDTLALVENYKGLGVYILHGDKDDNVPVSQARMMNDLLTKAGHPDFEYHEQPGAGHWWGNECVDWPGIFEMFRRRTIPAPSEVSSVTFVTADPGVSDRLHWLRVEAQLARLVPTSVTATLDRSAGRVSITSQNAAVVAFDASVMGLTGDVAVEIDGTTLEGVQPGRDGFVRLVRDGEEWKNASSRSAPVPIAGPFKRAFDNRFVLVYATRGSAEENIHSLSKARFDAETWWYRGNGSCDIVADDDFDPDAPENRDRNVILYGNADTNSVWSKLVPDDAPVSVQSMLAIAGDRRLEEEYAGVLFACRRRGAGEGGPLVGVIGATSAQAMRGLDRMPFFTSGVGFPDVLIVGSDMLMRGREGVRMIGFYGPDGRLGSEDVINQKGFDMPFTPGQEQP